MVRQVHVGRTLMVLALGGLAGCAPPPSECFHSGGEAWDEVCEAFDHDLGIGLVLLGDTDGRVFEWRSGTDEDAVWNLASASKWLAATAIMGVLERPAEERGGLTLETTVTDQLDWAEEHDASLQERPEPVTLRHLLSFTSGMPTYSLDPTCADSGVDLAACAAQFYTSPRAGFGDRLARPGELFTYGPAHLQVAAAMIESATGQPWADAVETEVVDAIGLSDEVRFSWPTEHAPRISIGASATARDLELFLLALLNRQVVSDSIDVMHTDHTPVGEVAKGNSPAIDFFGYDWHYGLGVWRECPHAEWRESCDDERIVSSVGAYGVFPWADFNRGRYGLIVRQDGIVFMDDDELNVTGAHSAQLSVRTRPLIDKAWP